MKDYDLVGVVLVGFGLVWCRCPGFSQKMLTARKDCGTSVENVSVPFRLLVMYRAMADGASKMWTVE